MLKTLLSPSVLKYKEECALRKFTLIELLVVIAIIGILLTLLLPSLARSRDASMRAVCLSQHKQVGDAKAIFLKNNNDKYASTIPGSTDHPGRQWMGKKGENTQWPVTLVNRPLNKYLGYTQNGIAVKEVECPLEYKGEDSFRKVGSSYFGNSYTGFNNLRNKFQAQINEPSSTVLVSEAGAFAYMQNISSTWWRMNHRDGKPYYPILRADYSAVQHLFSSGEGYSWKSSVANFKIQ